MKHGLYSVLDIKARAYIAPFTLPNDDMAVRAFKEAANDSTHMFCKHAEDYTLYRIGTFDDETGILSHGMGGVVLVTALACREDFVPFAKEA